MFQLETGFFPTTALWPPFPSSVYFRKLKIANQKLKIISLPLWDVTLPVSCHIYDTRMSFSKTWEESSGKTIIESGAPASQFLRVVERSPTLMRDDCRHRRRNRTDQPPLTPSLLSPSLTPAFKDLPAFPFCGVEWILSPLLQESQIKASLSSLTNVWYDLFW